MIRLLLSFIFFGLLFYAIFLYAPDTFAVLVSWAAKGFEWLHSLIEQISGRIEHPAHPATK